MVACRAGWIRLAPALALGLYLGRAASEWLRPGWPGAVALTLAAAVGAIWLLRRFPVSATWPLLLLLGYVVYPEPDPRAVIAAGAMAGLTAVLANTAARHNLWPYLSPRWLALLLSLSGLALYVATLAPGLLPADNGEFQLVAAELGVAHPPGFPLYTMMAHSFSRLPIGPAPAYRVNLLSALVGAATLALVYLSVYQVNGSRGAGLVTAVALAGGTTYWAQATTANIRGLTALFAALVLYYLLRYRAGVAAGSGERAAGWLTAAALALGLGLTHHPSLAFMAIIWGLFVLMIDPGLWRAPRRWVAPLLALLAGLLPLLYLPWRAAAGARGAAGLDTMAGFLDHVLARGFQGDFFAFVEPLVLAERVRVMGDVLAFQFSPWLLAGMGLGVIYLLWRDRPLAWLLGGSVAVHVIITATYRAPQTVEYMLPAYVPAVLALGCALGRTALAGERWWRPLLLAGLAVAALGQLVSRYPSYAALHRDETARDYAQSVLQQAPDNSIVLAHWHWVTPLWYLQSVEGMRPDVTITYVFPTGEPYHETWARETLAGLAAGRPVISTQFAEATAVLLTNAGAPPPLPLGDAFLYQSRPLTDLPAGYEPLAQQLDGGRLQWLGYRLEETAVSLGDEARLTVAWRWRGEATGPLTIFAHLVGADGALYGQHDQPVQPRAEGINLTQFRLAPRPGAPPGVFSLQIGAYDAAPLLDEAGQRRTAVAQLDVTPDPWPPATANPVWRPAADDGRVLVGYDWDNTLSGQRRLYRHWRTPGGYVTEVQDLTEDQVPVGPDSIGPWGIRRTDRLPVDLTARYIPLGQGIAWRSSRPLPSAVVPGQGPLRLDQRFSASRPVSRDLVVSVRLIGFAADGFHWAWWDLDDGVPALGAIPSLKWIAGSTIRDPHFLGVSPAAVPGQTVGGTVRLYDAFTERPLPILDERVLERPLPLIPLPSTTVSGSNSN